MGLSKNSIVDDENSLMQQVKYLIETYHQPVLVEEFIMGREFSVGILGNDNPEILPIIEFIFEDSRGIALFFVDPPVVPQIHQVVGNNLALPSRTEQPVCPADVSPELQRRIEMTALGAYKALGCRDWCRMEMRLGLDDILFVLELNPIAGIDPRYLLPLAARMAGLDYASLVNRILHYAMERMSERQPAFENN